MKVIVLGGAGHMGSRAVEDLAASEGVEKVAVADRNAASARSLASRLSSSPAEVSAVAIDVGNHHLLVEALSGYDVVASAVGPSHEYEAKLIRASLEADVDYVSLCDGWAELQDAIVRFDRRARDAGRVIMPGASFCPGVTGTAVRLLSLELDSPRAAMVSLVIDLSRNLAGEAMIKQGLGLGGPISPVFRNGSMQMVPTGSISRLVEVPRYGHTRVRNIGIPELVAVPRSLPELEEVIGAATLGKATGALLALGRTGVLADPRRIDAAGRLLYKLFRKTIWRSESRDNPFFVRVDVAGKKEGRDTAKTLFIGGIGRDITGIPLSVGAQLVARRELSVTEGGVYSIPECVEPRAYIRLLIERGMSFYTDVSLKDRLVLD